MVGLEVTPTTCLSATRPARLPDRMRARLRSSSQMATPSAVSCASLPDAGEVLAGKGLLSFFSAVRSSVPPPGRSEDGCRGRPAWPPAACTLLAVTRARAVQLVRPGTGRISSVRAATSRLYPDQLVYAPARDFVGGHELAGDQQPARSALSSGLPAKLQWGTGRSSRRPSGLVVKPRALFLAGGLC